MAMVVIGDMCVQSITAICRLPEALSFIVAMAGMCVQSIMAISGYYVGNSDFIYCCHGDGRHVCSKNHGHTHYNSA